MEHTSRVPVILLAGANTYQDRIRKQYAIQERERINRIFQEHGQTRYELISEDPAQGVFLFDLFRKYAFDESVKVLHLTGYSRGEYLHFDGGLGEEAHDVRSVVRQIEKLPGLELVFVNGCATEALLEALLLADIPTVIVTQTPQRDKATHQISQEFYQIIARGYTIRDAIEKLRVRHGQRFGFYPVVYDFEHNALRWENKREGHLQWGVYMLEANKQSLDWQLPVIREAIQGESLPELDLETPQRSRRIRLIGSGILVTAFMTMLLILLQGTGTEGGLLQNDWLADVRNRLFSASGAEWAQDCVFEDSLSYNILLLSFSKQEDCVDYDPYYTLSISRRLRRMAEREPDQEIHVMEEPLCRLGGTTPDAKRQVLANLIRDCNADLVIAGNYSVTPTEAINMEFQFMYEGLPNQATLDRLTAQFSPEMLDIGTDKFSTAVDDMVCWARGMSYFKRGRHSKAIEYLLKMRERQDKGYAIVDMRLAQCYEHLGKQAASRENFGEAGEYYQLAIGRLDHALQVDGSNAAAFNKRGNIYFHMEDYESASADFQAAIHMNPDYAEAYYNLGSLYLILKKEEEAETMLNRATTLKPDNRDYHGALAAAYAEQGETEMFYQELERALEKGFDIHQYPQAFGAYRDEDRFKELSARYR
jgi:Tfp pilus assembly protein PilF